MNIHMDALMTELGYISMLCSNFDYLMNEMNCSLINLENRSIGMLVSSKLNTQARVAMYKKLLELAGFPKKLIDESKKIIDDFDKVRNERNEFIHGIWHTKAEEEWDDDIALEDFYLSKLNSKSWDEARKVDVKELKKIRETLLSLLKKQTELNIKLLTTYRKILDANAQNKKKAYLAIKKAMKSIEIYD